MAATITVMALGSRGDVQPGVALGAGLRRHGYQVRLATYPAFAGLAHEYGLAFHALTGDITAMLSGEAGRAAMQSRNPLRLGRWMRQELQQDLLKVGQDALAASEDADALVLIGPAYYALALLEPVRCPVVVAALQPILPTRAFPNPILPPPLLDNPLVNLASHRIAGQLFWQLWRPLFNKARRQLRDLDPWPFFGPFQTFLKEGMPHLFAHSPHVLPKPQDWPPNAHVTGYWFLPPRPDWRLPRGLQNFLDAGPPPVYVGFGSMQTRSPGRAGNLVLRALEMTGLRGVLLRGASGLEPDQVPSGVYLLEDTPHDRLFPRMAAVVHHGGAGTTAAGLRAGVPSVLLPFFADQPFWAEQVDRLGVGPKPIPRADVTAGRLAGALAQATSDAGMRTRAAALGEKIRSEDGVGVAVRLLEETLRRA